MPLLCHDNCQRRWEEGKMGELVSERSILRFTNFLLSKYGKCTEKVRVLVRIWVRKKHKKKLCGYGNGYGFLSFGGTEMWTGYGLIYAPGGT